MHCGLHKARTVRRTGEGEKADDSSVSGITGEDGEVYLSGLPAQGHLQAVWGKECMSSAGRILLSRKISRD